MRKADIYVFGKLAGALTSRLRRFPADAAHT